MRRIYNIPVENELQSGMLKKIFVVPEHDSLIEFYVDSATCDKMAIEWFTGEKPHLWLLDEDDEWCEWWQKYLQIGAVYKTSSRERAFVEKQKNECIAAGAPTDKLVYWTRLWEAVKFIRKDRRIAV